MHTYILISSAFFATFALIWEKSTYFNLFLKIALMLMAIWGFAIVLTGSGVVQ